MTVLPVAERAPAPGLSPAAERATALFLHSGWRSCGTWIWTALRDSTSVRGFYEPLHEDLAHLDRAAIDAFRPESWGSGHSPSAPYFTEFSRFLCRGRRGVMGFRRRFAFDSFFADPEASDPELFAYITSLVQSAQADGKLPALKFCRSLGRVTWMERHFPDALHAVMLRDPMAQFQSGRVQLERDRNNYFVVAPFVIMARNAHHALLAEAMQRLLVRPPPQLPGGLQVTRDACWYHVKRLGWVDRYRGFLALWATSAITALSGEAFAIDADALVNDGPHRANLDEAMRTRGLDPLALPARTASVQDLSRFRGEERAEAARAAAAALEFVRDHRKPLRPERARLIERKLESAADGILSEPNCGTQLVPGPTAYAAAAAYVAALRVTYPLRRAHYHLDRWLEAR